MIGKKIVLPLWLFLMVSLGYAQKVTTQPAIVAGPMNGYSEHTEALVWVQTRCAKSITVKYRIRGKAEFLSQTLTSQAKSVCDPSISKFILTQLQMGTVYEYQILLDNVAQKFAYPLEFKTKVLWEWRTNPPDFTFIAGSCLYINDSAYDRPKRPPYGQTTAILKTMTQTPADFMLWLGDNTYLREADFSSKSGIEHRYYHTRSEPALQPFLAKMNHYAIWDDHDFGDNDANKNFELREVTSQCFKEYWGNKVYGENGKGIYSNFRYSDAEFFLLDDRSFRDESELNESFVSKTQLGREQITWLKNKLKHSQAVFKFICVGGQFLNEHTDKESFNLYKKEREEIIQFIVDQKISGVLFISGDRHFTELLKNDKTIQTLGYPLYDLTSSSITAGSSGVAGSPEENNPMRVPNTLVTENNFCTLKISGSKKGERVLLITCYDAKGIVKWGFSLKESELKAAAH